MSNLAKKISDGPKPEPIGTLSRDRIKSLMDTWLTRFSQKDAMKEWSNLNENPGILSDVEERKKEAYAFIVLAQAPKTLNALDRRLAIQIARDASKYSKQIMETNKDKGASPALASATIVNSIIREWQDKATQRSTSSNDDLPTDSKETAQTVLHERWKFAIKVFPLFNDQIGRLAFLSILALRSDGIEGIKPNFAQVITLAASRFSARALSGKIENVDYSDIRQVIITTEDYVLSTGNSPFDIPRLGERGSVSQQLSVMWKDVTILTDFSQRDPSGRREEGQKVWNAAEERLAYTAIAFNHDEVLKIIGKDGKRLLVGALKFSQKAMDDDKEPMPRLVAQKKDVSPQIVYKIAKRYLPPQTQIIASNAGSRPITPNAAPSFNRSTIGAGL